MVERKLKSSELFNRVSTPGLIRGYETTDPADASTSDKLLLQSSAPTPSGLAAGAQLASANAVELSVMDAMRQRYANYMALTFSSERESNNGGGEERARHEGRE